MGWLPRWSPLGAAVPGLAAALNTVLAVGPLRRLVPPHKLGGVDLSPLLAILLIQFVRTGLVYSLGISGRPLF